MQISVSRFLFSRRPANQRRVPSRFLSQPGVSGLATAVSFVALVSLGGFSPLSAEAKEIGDSARAAGNSAQSSGELKAAIKSESGVYIREARENENAPAPVRSYQGIPTASGFADDVSRAGVTFPVSFD